MRVRKQIPSLRDDAERSSVNLKAHTNCTTMERWAKGNRREKRSNVDVLRKRKRITLNSLCGIS